MRKDKCEREKRKNTDVIFYKHLKINISKVALRVYIYIYIYIYIRKMGSKSIETF